MINPGLPLISGYSLLQHLSVRQMPAAKEEIMKTFTQLFTNLLTRQNNAAKACSLLERAANARGLSQGDAAQLRGNAMAMLSVVR